MNNPFGTDTHCKTLYPGVSAQDNPVLPNPFRDRLAVSLSASLRNPVFRMYDMTGRLLLGSALAAGINEIETGGMEPGIYFWQVEAGHEKIKTGKLVKYER